MNKNILRDKDQLTQDNLQLLNSHFGLSYELLEDYAENIEQDGNIEGNHGSLTYESLRGEEEGGEEAKPQAETVPGRVEAGEL